MEPRERKIPKTRLELWSQVTGLLVQSPDVVGPSLVSVIQSSVETQSVFLPLTDVTDPLKIPVDCGSRRLDLGECQR